MRNHPIVFLFSILISLNCYAEKCISPKIQGFDLGNGLGVTRAFQLTGCKEKISEIEFQLFIPSLDKRQNIRITTKMDSRDFDIVFWDFTGDGYTDLLYTVSYGAGPFPNTNLWIFNPNENIFEASTSFPGEGRPFVEKTKGCVSTEERGGTGPGYQYYKNTWCIDPETKIWKFQSEDKI